MPSHPPLLLVIGTETPDQRRERQASAGGSSAESFAATLAQLMPDAVVTTCSGVDDDDAVPDLTAFDAVFFSGSPIAMHEDTQVTRRARRAMEQVFRSGTPAFGSCAGLHIAIVAAGGAVKPSGERLEAAFARRIVRTEEGYGHPLLRGRPASFEAPAMHSDEVDRIPDGGTLLAVNDGGRIQAMEIRSGPGIVWAVQYHPELSLREIADSVRRQGDTLLELGFARDRTSLNEHAERIEALADAPSRRDLRWQLGVTEDVTDPDRRRLEIANFLRHFVRAASEPANAS